MVRLRPLSPLSLPTLFVLVGGCLSGETVVLHEGADWYEARPETERAWVGDLEESEAVATPDGRDNRFSLVLDTSEELAVYSGGLDEALEPLAGHRVEIRGKLVDLSDEGFGEEIWPATITPAQ